MSRGLLEHGRHTTAVAVAQLEHVLRGRTGVEGGVCHFDVDGCGRRIVPSLLVPLLILLLLLPLLLMVVVVVMLLIRLRRPILSSAAGVVYREVQVDVTQVEEVGEVVLGQGGDHGIEGFRLRP